jgi:KDO2-lipid IV(A) lauroyltransferase
MSAPRFERSYLAPRYWPTWLGVGLLWLICLLPVPVILGLGSTLGRGLGRLIKRRRFVVRRNLELCFPELTPAQREALVDEHFAALGAGIFEAGLAWFASDARLRRHGEVVGIEHLRAALADGSGALLLTGHFTTLEIGGRYAVLGGAPFHAMYRPYNNAVADHYMHHWRESRSGLPALPRDDLRKLVRALRDGRCIWYAPDQTLDERVSVFAPFFGVPVRTINATSRLAQMGRARVVPMFPARIGGRWRVTFLPALENFPSGDDVADAARINRVLEEGIRMAPAQYFWVHRRFKWLPPGTPDVYSGR